MHNIEDMFLKSRDYYMRNGMKKTFSRMIGIVLKKDKVEYMKWRKRQKIYKNIFSLFFNHKIKQKPTIAIIAMVNKINLFQFRQFLNSINIQTYDRWILFLQIGEVNMSVKKCVSDIERENDKVHLFYGINQFEWCDQEEIFSLKYNIDYITFINGNDLLDQDAFLEFVKVVNKMSDIDFCYSDEDKVDLRGEVFSEPHFKPDFNIDLLCSMNYIGNLFFVKMDIIKRLRNGLRKDAINEYDLIFQCVEIAKSIYHIPEVLYHCRKSKDGYDLKPLKIEDSRKAIQNHYERIGLRVLVKYTEKSNTFHTIHLLEERPLVSVIIPNKDHVDDLRKCLNSILEICVYDNYEIIVVENNSKLESTFEFYQEMIKRDKRIHLIIWKDYFNYSAINNYGAAFAKGKYLWFLNNDTEVISPDCFEELLGYCMHKDVAAVGARLFYEDNTIQHAGVIIGFGGIAGHCFVNESSDENGYFSRIMCAQDLSAVTAACMLVDQKVFKEVHGFDERFEVAFNDVDLCLKFRKAGYLVVYNPYVELYHYESKSRGMDNTKDKRKRFRKEIHLFKKKWASILKSGDPYYNKNLSVERRNFGLK